MKVIKRKRGWLKFVVLVLVLAVLPVSVSLVQKNQENRSKASGYNDNACTTRQGVCLENSKSVKEGDSCKAGDKDGEFIFGLCGGGTDRRCCVPNNSGSSSNVSGNLSVATFNVGNGNKNGGHSASEFAAKLKNFDIVGLQESHANLTLGISSKSGLSNHSYVDTSAGNAIIGKITLSNPSYVKLTTCGSRKEFRAIQKTIINVNGKSVSFYNVHLDPDSACRKTEAKDAYNVIKNDSNPWILVGDFNFGLSACSTANDIFGNYAIIHDEHSGTKCTDMIIYTQDRGVKLVSSKTYFTRGGVSDHDLVSAVFEIN